MTGAFQKHRPPVVPVEVDHALAIILATVRELPAEKVPLGASLGRVLREPVLAPFDVPEADNSAMDGYAVRAIDIAPASGQNPIVLKVVGERPAGSVNGPRLTAGHAIRIMTGALIPPGADTVVQVELTDGGAEHVAIMQPVKPGGNIRRRGEDMQKGAQVLRPGLRIGPGEIGVLASAQKTSVEVSRKCRFAILSTGDELVEVGTERASGKVINSNRWALGAMVEEAGGVVADVGSCSDNLESIVAALRATGDCDFVLSTGGASAGAYDYLHDALLQIGADVRFSRVAMKPGKPVLFATLNHRLFFSLPGNPASCMVAFALFVGPAMRKAHGLEPPHTSPVVQARLSGPLRSTGDRRTYHRVRVETPNGVLVAHPARAQGSGLTTSMADANGLAITAPGENRVEAGELVDTLLMGPLCPA